MFERFTDRARRVVVLAQEEARVLNHNYIGTEHILLGLLREGDGSAAQTLESLGVRVEDARRQVEEIIGRGSTPPSGHVPFTPRAKKVLEFAHRETLELGHDHIGTEHLLLGLVREGEGVGVQVLAGSGIELSRVREAVHARLPSAAASAGSAEPQATAASRAQRQRVVDGMLDEIDAQRTEIARLRRLLHDHGIDPGEAA